MITCSANNAVGLLVAFALLGCEQHRESPSSGPVIRAESTASAEPGAGPVVDDPSFAAAEALLTRSARRWAPTPRQRPDASHWWGASVAGFREYRTEPETVKVFVYRFANEAAAASAEPEVRGALLDGTRAKLIRDGAFVFWIEAPFTLPNHPLAPEVNATFDAVVAALTSR